jgi:plastocyanin
MLRQTIVGCCILAFSAAACDETTSPPPLPEPAADQVGLPENYATQFTPFYVFDRPDNRQVRVVYANTAAAAAVSGRPFALGSILVMETWPAKKDAQGIPLVDANGRYLRDTLSGIFVMRKEKWFGRRYGVNQTGDWEYASFLADADRTPNVVGDAAEERCAICHLDAGPSRDWVYRANIHFGEASGAVPQPRPGQAASAPFVLNYTFVPGTITVPSGTRVTWTNEDVVTHTVTANDRAFSLFLAQGASMSRTFSTAGTFDYFCAVHDRMRGTVIVQ